MQILDGHAAPVYALAFSPDSLWLASGGKDGAATLTDSAGDTTPVCPATPAGYVPNSVLGIAFSTDGLLLAVGLRLGWSAYRRDGGGAWELVQEFSGFRGSPVSMGFLSDRLVAVGHGDRAKLVPGNLELFDAGAGRALQPVFQEPAGVRSVVVHQPSRTVAWSNGSRRVSVWTITKPDAVHLNLTHNAPAIAFHPDGTQLAVAQEWGAKLYDLAHRRERLALKGHKGTVSCLAFSPDGRTLATGSWDETVRLWDPLTGAERAVFNWPTGKVYAVAVSPDGTRLAAAGSSGSVVVWDAD